MRSSLSRVGGVGGVNPNNCKTSLDFKGFHHWSRLSNNRLQGLLWHYHVLHLFCV